MPHDDDALLTTWLGRVSRMPDPGAAPDEGDYKAVALELGLTEDDLARIEAAVEAHQIRGRNSLAHGRPDDAVAAFAQAHALAPWRRDIAHGLAEAYAARFIARGDHADRDAARALVEARLARDPAHQASYALLNTLDPPSAPARRGSAPTRSRLPIVIAGLAVLLLVTGVLFLSTTGDDTSDGPIVDAPPAPNAPPAASPDPSPNAPPASPALPRGTVDLPIETTGGDRYDGIEIDGAGSILDRGLHTSARVTLRIRNTQPGQGLDALAGTLEFLDDAGAVVAREPIELLNSAHPTLYPGEQHVFGRRLTVDPRATRARIALTTLRQKSATEPPPSEPICVQWDVDRPEPLDLEFGLRAARWNLGALSLDLTVRNRGTNAIDTLKVRVEHRTADDAPVVAGTVLDTKTVAATWMPPFEPGEQRRLRHMRVLGLDDKPRYDHTCLHVTTID